MLLQFAAALAGSLVGKVGALFTHFASLTSDKFMSSSIQQIFSHSGNFEFLHFASRILNCFIDS